MGHSSFNPMVPETPPCTAETPRFSPGARGVAHTHTDLSLGCQQVLQVGGVVSAPLRLKPVPALDGDGSLVHLVDKPGQRADSGPLRSQVDEQQPPPAPQKAQQGRQAGDVCTGGHRSPSIHNPLKLEIPQGHHLPTANTVLGGSGHYQAHQS